MFRHRLFGIEFKPTNHLNKQTGTQVSAQAGIEDFSGIFQERLRGTVGDGLLAMFDEVLESICHGASGNGVGRMLNVTFLSNNHIENVMRNSRGTLGKVCRGRSFRACR